MLPLFGKYFRRTKKEDVAVGSTAKGSRQASDPKSAVGGVPPSLLSSEVFAGERPLYDPLSHFNFDRNGTSLWLVNIFLTLAV
jgi:hypothetical protein